MEKHIKVNAVVKVDRDRIDTLLVGAVEGGSTYWCRSLDLTPKAWDYYKEHKNFYAAVQLGFLVVTHEGDKHTATEEDVTNALQLMAEKYPHHFWNVVNEQDDAETADVFLQLCCMREVVYG